MTKTEKIKHVTKSVIAFMDALGYEVVDDHDGYLTFSNGEGNCDNYIDYHRSYQDVYTINWCSEETKLVEEKLSTFVKQMVSQVWLAA
jgi:hypothetical protein